MKKYAPYVFLLMAVFLLFCAFDWPPEPYEMPRTVLTPDVVTDSLSGLRLSIGSIADTGLIILGILVPFYMIGPLIEKHFIRPLRIREGVDKNQFRRDFNTADRLRNRERIIQEGGANAQLRRDIRAADRRINFDSIMQDKIEEMELGAKARWSFRGLHPEIDLEERIYQKELSYSANFEFAKRHPTLGSGRGRKK